MLIIKQKSFWGIYFDKKVICVFLKFEIRQTGFENAVDVMFFWISLRTEIFWTKEYTLLCIFVLEDYWLNSPSPSTCRNITYHVTQRHTYHFELQVVQCYLWLTCNRLILARKKWIEEWLVCDGSFACNRKENKRIEKSVDVTVLSLTTFALSDYVCANQTRRSDDPGELSFSIRMISSRLTKSPNHFLQNVWKWATMLPLLPKKYVRLYFRETFVFNGNLF